MFLTKDVSDNTVKGVIKDIDEKSGTVTGYFSVFGNVDSDGDIIMPGAFTRTLNNNYKRLKHLNQHNTDEPLSGTKNDRLKISEDTKGLYFESKISETTYGKNTLLLYRDGVLDEHSIGYEVIKSRDSDTQFVERWGQKRPVKELIELKLWEGSTVTWGANPKARAESVKSMTKEQVSKKMQNVLSALKNGAYEGDEMFEMLELFFKQLEAQFTILSTTQPVDETTLDPQKGFKEESQILALLSLNNYSLKNLSNTA